MPKIITSISLTKYYGGALGIRDISFDVEEGDVFGFLGPNGAGKTTTIRILLDLLRPSRGRVEIFGRDVRKNSYSIRKQIGYLQGEFPAYANLHGEGFFQLITRRRGMAYNKKSALFHQFNLSTNDLNKKIKALSHGTLQKIGIIQAMMHQPRLLILDEPTTGLDPLMKEVFYDLLLEEQKRGTTIFFSSHNLDEVEKLCNRVAIIRQGKLVGLESLEVLKKKAGQILEFKLEQDNMPFHLPGAELIKQQGQQYKFRITKEIRPVLHELSKLPFEDLSISKPDLEELFVTYYQHKSKEGHDIS